MKRLLQFAYFLFGMTVFAIGVTIMAPKKPVPTPEPVAAIEPVRTTEAPTTSVAPEPPPATARAVQLHPTTTAPRPAAKKITTTTSTTEAPRTPLKIAQSYVGKTGPFAEGGFWCAKFVSWIAEQAKVESFQQSDSPARLHTIAKEPRRLTDTPLPGYLVFIDLTGENNANDYITHVGIVESVDGNTLHTIEGNADDSGLVSRQVRELGDRYVIDFAPFDDDAQSREFSAKFSGSGPAA